jgi:predicted enzyme related to lactoylglutathione lyase
MFGIAVSRDNRGSSEGSNCATTDGRPTAGPAPAERHRVSAVSITAESEKNKEAFMNQGISLVVYPVKDIAQAKTVYSTLLGVDPYVDQPYYVGFRVGDQEVGLDPNGHKQGMTGPLGYREVDDIETSLKLLLDAGAQLQQAAKDVGGGKLVATVKDPDGNVTGLVQSP